MSKISYCSLEEAWGNKPNKNKENTLNRQENKYEMINDNKIENKENKEIKKNNIDNEQLNSYRSRSQIDYEELKNDNEKMKKIINSMNLVERINTPENNINEEFNKYRFNPINKVNSIYADSKNYKPFQEEIENKSLTDRFVELENEFRKYKTMINTRNINNENEDTIESFSNFDNNNKTDIQDLIVLIVLGLIIIFIMDNIFKLGKYLGSKKI